MKTVIAIDDNIDTLTVIKLLLSIYGYRVLTFSEWKAGINKVFDISPSLILMGTDLGTADGRNLSKQLKFNKATRHIPILLCSSNAKVKDQLSECEADDFLKKPLKCNRLVQKVISIIGLSGK